MRIGLYPGTFDPVTVGHRDIIRRAMLLFDRLVIAVAANLNKSPLFDIDERTHMMSIAAKELQDSADCELIVVPFDNLLVDCAKEHNATVLIRGLRAVSDFEFEYQMVGMNRALDPDIETVFLMADAHFQPVASRLVKEVAKLGGDVNNFVTPDVVAALQAKFSKG